MRKLIFILLGIFLLLLAATMSRTRLPGAFIADEATYFMMTQSLAEDGDLRFTVGDLERVWQDWPNGPEGVILKTTDGGETVYYSKPYIYSMLVVPFYLALGVNGFLVFNALLVLVMVGLGARYLARGQSDEGRSRALLFSVTFFLVSAAFPYLFWIQPEIFYMFLVFCGCYLALPPHENKPDGASDGSKVAAPAGPARWPGDTPLHRFGRLLGAAVFFGLAASVKWIGLVFLPLLFLGMRERGWTRFRRLLSASAFLLLAVFVYHGIARVEAGGWLTYFGDRRSFNHESSYPGVAPAGELWQRVPKKGTDKTYGGWERLSANLLNRYHLSPRKFVFNLLYYFTGRHTGIFVYFFPSLVCLAGWFSERRYRDRARLWLLLAIAANILYYLVLLPHNYQGGGGFIGNRYFLAFYAAFFFLRCRPPGRVWLGASWAVAGLFLSQILFTPFGALTDRPSLQAHGRNPVFRFLPYETTLRFIPGYEEFRQDGMFIRLLDTNAFKEDESHFWVKGRHTARVLFASPRSLSEMVFHVSDPAVEISSLGDRGNTILEDNELNPERDPGFRLFRPGPAIAVHPLWMNDRSYHFYLLAFHSPRGTLPYLDVPGSRERRFLGCRVSYLGGGPPWENPLFYQGSVAVEPDALDRLAATPAGEISRVESLVTNDSPFTWRSAGEHPVMLSYHWFSADSGERVVWDGTRTPLDPIPGGSGPTTVEMTVRFPEMPGDYLLQPDLLCDGISWFADRQPDQSRFPRHAIRVDSSTPGEEQAWNREEFYRAAAVDVDLPETFDADGETWLTVTVRNDGTAAWPAEGFPAVRLSYHWADTEGDSVIWDGLHTALPEPLEPGQTLTVRMRIACPPDAGEYRLQLDLVCDGVNWFSTVNGSVLRDIPVTVS